MPSPRLICAGALLAAAFLIEAETADQHRHMESFAVYACAVFSCLLSLWPTVQTVWDAAERRRTHWQLAVIAAAIVAVVMHQTMIVALSAFVFSCGFSIWRYFTTGRQS